MLTNPLPSEARPDDVLKRWLMIADATYYLTPSLPVLPPCPMIPWQKRDRGCPPVCQTAMRKNIKRRRRRAKIARASRRKNR